MKKMFASLITTAAVGASVVALPPAQAAAHHKSGTRSLATVLAADGQRFDRRWNDFDILDKAVATVLEARPGTPVAVLANGKQRLTAFLPTDRAFRRLVHDLTGKRPRTERATFKAVATLGPETIEQVLLYHVVLDKTITYRQALKANGAQLPSALGPVIGVKVWHRWIVLKDRDFNDRNPVVLRRLSDINKGNRQIAHGINRVLRPADL